MMISTKGRYALRVMIDLAENGGGEYIALADICERQGISKKYLESIMTVLSKAGMIDGRHGKGGGYKLNRDPKDYTVGSILKLTEGTLAPVACLENNAHECERRAECRTLPLWKELDAIIDDYLEKVTIADLVRPKTK